VLFASLRQIRPVRRQIQNQQRQQVECKQKFEEDIPASRTPLFGCCREHQPVDNILVPTVIVVVTLYIEGILACHFLTCR
jgi:hypothetical protein